MNNFQLFECTIFLPFFFLHKVILNNMIIILSFISSLQKLQANVNSAIQFYQYNHKSPSSPKARQHWKSFALSFHPLFLNNGRYFLSYIYLPLLHYQVQYGPSWNSAFTSFRSQFNTLVSINGSSYSLDFSNHCFSCCALCINN